MRLLIGLLFVFSAAASVAGDNLSATEQRYQTENAALFHQFMEAHQLLNTWRGQSSVLNRGEAMLSRILEIDDQYALAYREYGRLLIMVAQGHPQGGELMSSAESVIRHAIDIEPDYADAYVLLGHLYTRTKNFGQAKVALLKADELGTPSPWLANNWADFYVAIGNPQKALPLYQSVVDGDTSNLKAKGLAARNVARIYQTHGTQQQVRQAYEVALAIEPDYHLGWTNYAAQLLFKFGDVQQAIIKAQKAQSLADTQFNRLTLASAYCMQWVGSEASNEQKDYLNKTLSVVPDPALLLEQTAKYSNTSQCADKLRTVFPHLN